MYKQILVPLEEGKDSWTSLDHARELAAQLGAALVLLRVITVLPAGHEFDRCLQIEVDLGALGSKRRPRQSWASWNRNCELRAWRQVRRS